VRSRFVPRVAHEFGAARRDGVLRTVHRGSVRARVPACLCAKHVTDAGVAGNCLQDAFAECAGFRPTAAQVGCPVTN
jgi:hypothetical protein